MPYETFQADLQLSRRLLHDTAQIAGLITDTLVNSDVLLSPEQIMQLADRHRALAQIIPGLETTIVLAEQGKALAYAVEGGTDASQSEPGKPAPQPSAKKPAGRPSDQVDPGS